MNPTVISTDQFRAGAFDAHGEVRIWFADNILYYEATGPFNKEAVSSLARAQMEYLRHLQPSGPWGSMAVFRTSALMGPECLESYAQMLSKPLPLEKTPVATAFVMDDAIEGHRLMPPLYAKIFAHLQRPFQCVETIAQAQQWLLEEIARVRRAAAPH